jgi:hypothetical protein
VAREYAEIITYCDDKVVLVLPLAMTQLQGIGLPPITRRTLRAPFQHGSTYKGFKLEERVLQFTIHLRACSRAEMWEERRRFIRALNPLPGPLVFRIHLDTGEIFDLNNVSYDGVFTAPMNTVGEVTTQDIALRLIAHDPIWLGPETTIRISTSDPVNELLFPATFPIRFGVFFVISDTISLQVTGDWKVYPTIRILGPMDYPLIENQTTDQKIKLNYQIPAGDEVTVTLDPGNKTVVDSHGTNLFSYVSSDSDFAEFALDPDPMADNGVNSIFVYGESGGTGSRFSVSFRDRYSGI